MSPSRLLKKSPWTSLEGRLVAIVEANLTGQRAVGLEFSPAVAAGLVHFVMA
jgi:hypothetical protein